MLNFLITMGLVAWFIINLVAIIIYVIIFFEDSTYWQAPIYKLIAVVLGFILVFSSCYWWVYCIGSFNT